MTKKFLISDDTTLIASYEEKITHLLAKIPHHEVEPRTRKPIDAKRNVALEKKYSGFPI